MFIENKLHLKRKYMLLKYIVGGGIWSCFLYWNASAQCKALVKEDVCAVYGQFSIELLLKLLFDEHQKPFRNILYYRFRQDNCNRRILKIATFLIRPLSSVEIGGYYDGGLRIVHNYCVISVQKAGKNLKVLQGVTIGKNGNGNKPVIGDNVVINANAVVFGKIEIGNNVIIGAGSMVNKSIPDNCVVAGNPARIIRKNGVAE